VAYNYGVYEYTSGHALLAIGVAVPDVAAALAAAAGLGFALDGDAIVGPDGYRYELSPLAGPYHSACPRSRPRHRHCC
jgi:hypothetical protein